MNRIELASYLLESEFYLDEGKKSEAKKDRKIKAFEERTRREDSEEIALAAKAKADREEEDVSLVAKAKSAYEKILSTKTVLEKKISNLETKVSEERTESPEDTAARIRKLTTRMSKESRYDAERTQEAIDRLELEAKQPASARGASTKDKRLLLSLKAEHEAISKYVDIFKKRAEMSPAELRAEDRKAQELLDAQEATKTSNTSKEHRTSTPEEKAAAEVKKKAAEEAEKKKSAIDAKKALPRLKKIAAQEKEVLAGMADGSKSVRPSRYDSEEQGTLSSKSIIKFQPDVRLPSDYLMKTIAHVVRTDGMAITFQSDITEYDAPTQTKVIDFLTSGANVQFSDEDIALASVLFTKVKNAHGIYDAYKKKLVPGGAIEPGEMINAVAELVTAKDIENATPEQIKEYSRRQLKINKSGNKFTVWKAYIESVVKMISSDQYTIIGKFNNMKNAETNRVKLLNDQEKVDAKKEGREPKLIEPDEVDPPKFYIDTFWAKRAGRLEDNEKGITHLKLKKDTAESLEKGVQTKVKTIHEIRQDLEEYYLGTVGTSIDLKIFDIKAVMLRSKKTFSSEKTALKRGEEVEKELEHIAKMNAVAKDNGGAVSESFLYEADEAEESKDDKESGAFKFRKSIRDKLANQGVDDEVRKTPKKHEMEETLPTKTLFLSVYGTTIHNKLRVPFILEIPYGIGEEGAKFVNQIFAMFPTFDTIDGYKMRLNRQGEVENGKVVGGTGDTLVAVKKIAANDYVMRKGAVVECNIVGVSLVAKFNYRNPKSDVPQEEMEYKRVSDLNDETVTDLLMGAIEVPHFYRAMTQLTCVVNKFGESKEIKTDEASQAQAWKAGIRKATELIQRGGDKNTFIGRVGQDISMEINKLITWKKAENETIGKNVYVQGTTRDGKYFFSNIPIGNPILKKLFQGFPTSPAAYDALPSNLKVLKPAKEISPSKIKSDNTGIFVKAKVSDTTALKVKGSTNLFQIPFTIKGPEYQNAKGETKHKAVPNFEGRIAPEKGSDGQRIPMTGLTIPELYAKIQATVNSNSSEQAKINRLHIDFVGMTRVEF